ncbi:MULTISPECIES: outer membrane protein assembly factor BamD [Legionella]|uniref:Outer membrane protein assembly factor BamD n=1 Tax=Legionella septentrionalis TaxID=2498109 RepID=A0A433JJN8_9GAMM|nr:MULTISPECIES: outer membrane protein assembly factor BamD [Legionella]MCP0913338.1 outer membrane protein assembly factor BamD [Legionella sp. 27cVA30]RUQ88382.1 outer membrane protein assembly factor BamD [Legionella septentrionalis]RUQ93069.1 outer membrane protein assembly factor BamD [Legionella septentrionalis]RUR09488.1 outer membrane protein assembly factor BamD [Legionella septentrionalis]RUR13245.1 outer membrane protein assembly factor BamD [Legionella septentrionalis]
MKLIKIFSILILLSTLTGCPKWWGGGDDEEYNPFQGVSAKQLYTEAKQALAKEEYESAIKRLEALETMYPFNDYAEKAELELVYAYYKKGDYPSTAAAADRYIHLYPRAKNVDYAYYLKGLANFQQTRGTLANILPIDESWRDPGTQSQAYTDFATLVQQFPDSRYKANALQRMIYLRNLFAQRELNVANYYYSRKMYVAAIERASYLIKNYPQAPSAKPALAIVYHANVALGLTQAADDALRVYEATYHSKPAAVTMSE